MTKILIDKAVVRQWLEWFLWFQSCRDEKAPMTSTQVRDSIRQALANEALDKMAENAKELGLEYMEGSAEQYVKELEQPAPVRYQRIERGDGDWMDCTKEQYEKAMARPEWDTRVIATPQAQPAPAQTLTGLLSIARKHPEGRVVTVSFRTVEDAMAFEKYAIEAAQGIAKGGAA